MIGGFFCAKCTKALSEALADNRSTAKASSFVNRQNTQIFEPNFVQITQKYDLPKPAICTKLFAFSISSLCNMPIEFFASICYNYICQGAVVNKSSEKKLKKNFKNLLTSSFGYGIIRMSEGVENQGG